MVPFNQQTVDDSQTQLTWPQRILRVLYHPLVLISVVLHGLFLLAPVPSTPGPTADEETVTEEEEAPVDLLGLAELAPPEPPPPSPQPTPQVAPPPVAPSPQPQAVAPAPAPPPTVAPPAPAPASPTPQASPTEPAPTTPPTPAPQPTPTYDPQADRQAAISGLDNLSQQSYPEQLSANVIYNYLTGRDGPKYQGLVGTFFTADGIAQGGIQTLPGIVQYRLYDKGVSETLEQLQSAYGSQGNTFTEATPNYANQPLYEMSNSDGQLVFHLSLVPLEGSTVLVLWNVDPRTGE
ncbi:MAG: hypothetical protein ACTS2F_30505 [Thainema sp.]